MKHIIVGTAGHIDHGKTALIKALTGIDTDRLKEEKERGITIDIGFAHLHHGGVRFGFVDVPGHERFVKNMLAGAHGIDLVMLVVAATESVMPQTREHFDICRLLRVKSGLVVITKIDLVDEEMIELVAEDIRELVAGSFLEQAPVVRVSSRTGEGIEELKETLVALAASVPEKTIEAVARLPIDRVFTLRGFGTVVTGTLIAGQFSPGQEVEILPRGRRATIRGIQVHGQSVERARAGERTALNLQGVAVEDLQRGDVVVPVGRFRPTSMIDARLELLPTAPQAITTRTRVRCHLGTAELLARVVMLDREAVRPGESALVQLRLESPTCAVAGDRFIVRRYSPPVTIGGGVVLHPQAEKHRPFRPGVVNPVVDQLQALETSTVEDRLVVWITHPGEHGMSLAQLAALTDFTESRLESTLAELVAQRRIVELPARPRHFLSCSAYEETRRLLQRYLEEYHRKNPLEEGAPRNLVREKVLGDLPESLSSALLSVLLREPEFRAERESVRLASHQVRLSGPEADAERRLVTLFREAGLQPPTLEEAAQALGIPPTLAQQLHRLLVQRGTWVRIGEHTFDAQVIQTLIEQIRARKALTPTLDVGTFKQITGVSRKYAIPLLEYLDQLRITCRVGNDRIIL
ncbi:MAG TPA: selenocysteine-specific translation elongation factor [Blastocatellia bacterium]|nr:selenocysteine-specific translation elongation factor [Blastocatellia bacterium]